MKLYIDINTGEIRRTLTGAVLPSLKFYVNDIITLTLVLIDAGVAVTSSYFVAGTKFNVAIRGYPLTATPLVQATAFNLVTQDASGVLDLTVQALSDYFTANVPSGANAWAFLMEIQITANDTTTRQTFAQPRILIARDLNTLSAAITVNITDSAGADITDSNGSTVTGT